MNSPIIFDAEADKKLMDGLLDVKLKIQHDNKLMISFRNLMAKDKFQPGQTQELFKQLSNPNAVFTTIEKYFLAKNLYTLTRDETILPENYFPLTVLRRWN
ncbi:hypothetical protein QKW52_22175 [Bacillus sonorensis]|nr:hypothetical protein [Bacillus sonorensis]